MRRAAARWLLSLVFASLLAACGSLGPQPITYTAFQLTCCAKADIDQPWRPGTAVQLHWIIQQAPRTTTNPSHTVTISTVLTGPYPSVESLKASNVAARTVTGSVIQFDDRIRPNAEVATTFALPADLPAGFYRLDIKWDFGDGNSAGSGTVVQVGGS